VTGAVLPLDLYLGVSEALSYMASLRFTCWVVGDIIGCGVDLSQNKVFYTKNSSLLGKNILTTDATYPDQEL